MKVQIIEVKTNQFIDCEITPLSEKLIPAKNNGWNFNWKSLYKTEGSNLYKISTKSTRDSIEGIVMLTVYNEEMLFMNNIELAPHNIGRNKKFEKVAGCLIAFACKMSFLLGKGNYNGFLAFDSKTELIELYISKYGATLASGNKMFFSPQAGNKLMKQYFEIKN